MSAAFEHHWMIPEPLRSHVGGAEQVINQLAKSVLVKPSPVVVSWAVVLLDNPAISAGKLAEIVSLDPVLSCKAFSFANAQTCVTTSVSLSIDEALMRIGLAKSRGFVLASTFPEIYRRDNPDLLDQVDDQWKSSLCRAIIAREIAKNTRFASADEVYACALITSCVPIAKLYMSRESRELVRAVGVREEVALALCLGRTALWPEEWICSAAGVLLDTKLSRSLVLAEMLNTGNLTDAQSATALDEETLEQARQMEISEAALQRIVASASKSIRDRYRQLGVV